MGMGLLSPKVEAFVEVARLKNFSKAAKLLHVTQSALSQRIRSLEEELNHSLFIRGGPQLQLTDIGEKLLTYCLSQAGMEAEFFNGLVAKEADALVGILRVGAYSSVGRSLVLPALAKIAKKHPQVRLQLLTENVDRLATLLLSSQVDVVLCDQPIESSRVICQSIACEQYVLAKAAHGACPDIYIDANAFDQITFEFLHTNQQGSKDIERIFLGDVYTMMDGVEAGLGFAVLPRHLIRGRSMEVLEDLQSLKKPIYLAYLRVPYVTPLLRAGTRALMEQATTIAAGDLA